MSKGKILFQLTGSIACFKACQLLSQLVQAGYEVEVVASQAALSFVGAATLEGLTGRPVHSEVFARGEHMSHIHLVRWADMAIICPATANTVNKLASGLGDDLISTIFLAHDFLKPYLIAPAMNDKMFWHPATQASLETLQAWGVTILPTESGALACGEEGAGRLLDPAKLITIIQETFDKKIDKRPEHPLHVLVTAGGTREPIDGVRSIANFSTGRTGVSIAERLVADGHRVTLLRAKDAARPKFSPRGLRERVFVTFKDLQEDLREELTENSYDAVFHAAAVSDFSVAGVPSGKIESSGEVLLRLRPNPKLVDSLRSLSRNPDIKIVAFKLTNSPRSEERREAVRKLALHARPDFIVHNDLSEISDSDVKGSKHKARVFSSNDPDDLREIAVTESKERLAQTLESILKGAIHATQS